MIALEACTVTGNPAAWKCLKCGPKCADQVRRVKGARQAFKCHACGADAELLRASRAELHPFLPSLRKLLVVLGRPLLGAILVSLVMLLSAPLGVLGLGLGLAVALLLAAGVVKSEAEGVEFDWPSPADANEQIAVPLGKAALAFVPVLVAAGVGVYPVVLRYEAAHDTTRSLAMTLLASAGFWVTVALLVVTAAGSITGLVTSETVGGAALPSRAYKGLLKHLKAWGILTGVVAVAVVVAFAIRWLLPAGMLGLWVTSLVGAYALFAGARIAGRLVWTYPVDFGVAELEPLVDLGDPKAPAEWIAPVVAAPPRPVIEANFKPTVESQIRAALDAKDQELVLKLYTAGTDTWKELTTETLVRVGQDLAALTRHSLALSALSAASGREGPEAAKAFVIAARIHDERLRDAASAKKLYAEVIRKHPGSKAAEYAEKQLADPRFQLAK